MWRWLLVLGLAVGNPVLAQDLPRRADPVEALPGAGRPVAKAVFAARRAALLAHTGPGVAIVPAGSRADIEADVRQDNDFRQDDDFFYLTGVETPDAWLVLASDGSAGEAILLLPAANPMMQRWTGSQLAPGPDAAALTGIADVRAFDRDSLTDLLAARLAGGSLYTPVGNRRTAPFVIEGKGSKFMKFRTRYGPDVSQPNIHITGEVAGKIDRRHPIGIVELGLNV